jgi:hypothetical protein
MHCVDAQACLCICLLVKAVSFAKQHLSALICRHCLQGLGPAVDTDGIATVTPVMHFFLGNDSAIAREV